jgi:hypothetical protein
MPTIARCKLYLKFMPGRRTRFNCKRKIAETPPPKEALKLLEKEVRYGGKPEHKRNSGNFRLSPPARPRRDKSLCDEAGIFLRSRALELLRAGVRRGLISAWDGTNYPQNIWSMTEDGIPLEAQLENAGNGTYHGYPLMENDPFRKTVIEKWSKSKDVND